jgi:hypothetical protein
MERQRPQQHGIDDAENRRRGAGAETERRDRDRGEPRTLGEQARRVPQILSELVDPHRSAHVHSFSVRALEPPPHLLDDQLRDDRPAMRRHPQPSRRTSACKAVRPCLLDVAGDGLAPACRHECEQ